MPPSASNGSGHAGNSSVPQYLEVPRHTIVPAHRTKYLGVKRFPLLGSTPRQQRLMTHLSLVNPESWRGGILTREDDC